MEERQQREAQQAEERRKSGESSRELVARLDDLASKYNGNFLPIIKL